MRRWIENLYTLWENRHIDTYNQDVAEYNRQLGLWEQERQELLEILLPFADNPFADTDTLIDRARNAIEQRIADGRAIVALEEKIQQLEQELEEAHVYIENVDTTDTGYGETYTSGE